MRFKYSVKGFLLFLFTLMVMIGLIAMGVEKLGYHWQWYRVPGYLFSFEEGRFTAGALLEGLEVTLRITGISLVLAFSFGLTAAFLRLSDSLLARGLARGYVEIVRNTPLLVQLFFIYFVLAPILDLGRLTSAILALSLFEGAYACEIFRAGIVSIHRGQWEAAYSLGLNAFAAYRHIILPQALRRILPPLTGQGISLIKDSALVSTVAIYDLTMRGQEIISETYLAFELWFTIAAIYLMMTLTLSAAVHFMESRFKLVT